VIGDRETDLELARAMGIRGFRLGSWNALARALTSRSRVGRVRRDTQETKISAEVDLDGSGQASIRSGIGFFDHMLEQLAKHSGFDIAIKVEGDLHVDEHHTIEDTALALGAAIRDALGDKIGIGRYGFYLPMDEAGAKTALDLSGRAYFKFKGKFDRDAVGGLPTEMVPHFFKSLADGLGATLHIEVEGRNNHHMIEAAFKAVARSLRMAAAKTREGGLPSTKGVL
jgi:imidazoleglycerol-phosphate dehydratase/histidinol-phosphatase